MTELLTDAHRLFMQAMLVEQCYTEEDIYRLAEEACRLTNEPWVDWLSFHQPLRDQLDRLGFDLTRGHDPVTGRVHYAFVNTVDDEWTKGATDCTPTELAYFRTLVDLIMHQPHPYQISSIQALQATRHLLPASLEAQDEDMQSSQDDFIAVPITQLSQSAAEVLLNRWVKQKWLGRTREGSYYYLNTRSLLELEQYLEEMYPDTKRCGRCHKLCSQGTVCEQPAGCEMALHVQCERGLRRHAHPKPLLCPQCRYPWPEAREQSFEELQES